MTYLYFTLTATSHIERLPRIPTIDFGINSKYHKAIVSLYERGIPVQFVDNPFRHYRHEKHLAAIQLLRPRHATLRDYISLQDCERLGIPYYSFATLLQHYRDIREYVTQPIVISKVVEAVSDIPEDALLGFTFPSPYAGVGLSFDTLHAFRQKQVHLLGGSTLLQYVVYLCCTHTIASLDNNHISRIASFGRYFALRTDPMPATWPSTHQLFYLLQACQHLTTTPHYFYALAFLLTILRWHVVEHRGCPDYWEALTRSLTTLATLYHPDTLHWFRSSIATISEAALARWIQKVNKQTAASLSVDQLRAVLSFLVTDSFVAT